MKNDMKNKIEKLLNKKWIGPIGKCNNELIFCKCLAPANFGGLVCGNCQGIVRDGK